MINLIVGAVIGVIVVSAAVYLYKEKKKGVKCVGCPSGCSCTGTCGGCNCQEK